MNIDPATSTITIGGRRFPAAALICPPYEDDPDPEVTRMIGGPAVFGHLGGESHEHCTVMIPCESGLLFQLDWCDATETAYQMQLLARTCELTKISEPLWLPHFMCINVKVPAVTVLPYPDMNGSPWFWEGADPEWVVEHIDRVSKMPFVEPPGPRVRLISLAECHKLNEEWETR